MAGNKYLERNQTSGRVTEKVSADSSAGVADAGRVVALNAAGEIDASMLPVGIGADATAIEAFENLAVNDLVDVFDDAGTPKVRKADATGPNPRPAVGFVKAAVVAGNNAVVYFDGRLEGLVGLTPGARQYLGTTPGVFTSTPISGAGNAHQFVGRAISVTAIEFEPDDPIILA